MCREIWLLLQSYVLVSRLPYISLLLPPAARENPALHFGFPLTAYIRTGRFRSCFIQLLRIQFGRIRLSCCHWKVSVRPQTQPLSSASGSKRYNTLDFPWKVVCQQGCSRPYWKPRAKGAAPLWTPAYFLRKSSQTVKMQFDINAQKIQNRCNFHPAWG